jgi:hypothetical protein
MWAHMKSHAKQIDNSLTHKSRCLTINIPFKYSSGKYHTENNGTISNKAEVQPKTF